jgi:hypothetical protein
MPTNYLVVLTWLEPPDLKHAGLSCLLSTDNVAYKDLDHR